MSQKAFDNPKEYIETRVDKDSNTGCWNWKLAKGSNGYGVCNLVSLAKELKVTRPHQLAYKVYKGEIPENLCVLHTCDNRACVNPEHLFIGSYDDNNKDMRKKGRNLKKLSLEQRGELIAMKNTGITLKEAGKKFGVSISAVWTHWNK